MGAVYMAEQVVPVRRLVALKILKLGMDTRRIIARFEAERQALAMMEHPNIARVLDAGASDTGRPYFVMELVRGIPITAYCDQHHLPLEDRLKLFCEVCRAVQHAHQKGIIHRDLKPANILVALHDGTPTPKIIDFGIAKATHQRLTDKTLFTTFEQFIGTPQYMSPEQTSISGLDVDTRSDIYSLGVVLYELLTSQTLFDAKTLQSTTHRDLPRLIQEIDPPAPSTRLSALGDEAHRIAQNRRTDSKALIKRVRGDLNWIVMKALEKDRTRRYDTALELAQDVECHLRS
jgi:serine/threonine protein kinase